MLWHSNISWNTALGFMLIVMGPYSVWLAATALKKSFAPYLFDAQTQASAQKHLNGQSFPMV